MLTSEIMDTSLGNHLLLALAGFVGLFLFFRSYSTDLSGDD
jgi:hypothetical protein